MQYPVPQFTDVEDKIIGSLTVKQFGILFLAGVIIFAAYSVTKSILVGAFFFILFGIPALGIAFARINGRPLYATLPYIIKFIQSPKILIFHKEAHNFDDQVTVRNITIEKQPEIKNFESKSNSKTRLLEVSRILEKQAQEEHDLLSKK